MADRLADEGASIRALWICCLLAPDERRTATKWEASQVRCGFVPFVELRLSVGGRHGAGQWLRERNKPWTRGTERAGFGLYRLHKNASDCWRNLNALLATAATLQDCGFPPLGVRPKRVENDSSTLSPSG